VRRCPDCGTGATDPRPSPEALDAVYSRAYYGPDNVKFTPAIERLRSAAVLRRARWIDRQLGRRGRILEIGCGPGALLAALAGLGHECHGTERSELAALGAKRVRGIAVHARPIEECGFAAGSFDAAILWHVLEHLEDPPAVLAQLHELLRSGGLLILEVPNYSSWQARASGSRWFHLDLPRHLHHFSAEGMARLFASSGFRGESLTTFSFEHGPFGVLQSAFNRFDSSPEYLYRILKQEVRPAPGARLARYALAAVLLPPAFALAVAESIAGRGGVLRVVARRAG